MQLTQLMGFCLCPSVSVCLSLFLSLSLCLCLCLCLSLTHTHTRTHAHTYARTHTPTHTHTHTPLHHPVAKGKGRKDDGETEKIINERHDKLDNLWPISTPSPLSSVTFIHICLSARLSVCPPQPLILRLSFFFSFFLFFSSVIIAVLSYGAVIILFHNECLDLKWQYCRNDK